MSKEEYVLNRVKLAVADKLNKNQFIDPYYLNELIEQWEFDYGFEKEIERNFDL